jgi:hypothetical protein
MSRPIQKSLILIFAVCLYRYAGALEPCDKYFEKYSFAVERAADTAQKDPNSVTVTTLPSFRPESALRIANNAVFLIEFNSSIWYEGFARDGVSPKLGLKMSTAPLSPSLATRLAQTFSRQIGGAKPSDRRGLDGVTYRFSTPEAGCAQTWSPDESSVDGKLVQILNLLEEHARIGGPSSAAREQPISSKLDEL